MLVSSKVPGGFGPAPIAAYLAARFTYLSREEWEDLVGDGRITANGAAASLATQVSAGDEVACDLPDFAPPAVNLNVGLLYEDEWLLAVNKPPGLRVHSQGRFVTANLIYHLRHQHQPPYPEAHLAHRLDADTSGVVVLARDKETLAALARQFERGEVHKTYLALVHGVPAAATGKIDLPIGKIKGGEVTRYGVMANGKTAVTYYRLLQQFGQAYAMLELRPAHGRTHQLRVHCTAVGHPIVGDALYTMDEADYLAWRREGRHQGEMDLIPRQALHCARLELDHPRRGTAVAFTALLPADIEELLAKLPDIAKKE
ncbi:MAG: RluA family pseudouridine synthase [Ardenticatenaceae bacterium]|nr:RluA family pseudouridine synthase [Ardenticatenaceae bacterium]MCB8986377.1 RluA family pseudouridine synthase [Ardenticatenaceae bacterium]